MNNTVIRVRTRVRHVYTRVPWFLSLVVRCILFVCPFAHSFIRVSFMSTFYLGMKWARHKEFLRIGKWKDKEQHAEIRPQAKSAN